MDHKGNCADQDNVIRQPDFFRAEVTTQTIDLDHFFSKDITESGSFDIRHIKNGTFGKLMEAVPIPAILVDADHRIIHVNGAFRRIDQDGCDAGMQFSSLFATGRDMAKADGALRSVFAQHKIQVLEGPIQRGPRGMWVRINFRAIRFKSHKAVLAIFEDLTPVKKQLTLSQKYQQLVEVFPVGLAEFSLVNSGSASASNLITLTGEAKLVNANQQFAKMLGFDSIEEIRGMNLIELEFMRENPLQIFAKWFQTDFSIFSFETRSKNGLVVYENKLVGNLRNGNPIGFWLMRQDITVRKQVEEDLRSARDRLEERVRERTADLMNINNRLTEEIQVRKQAEQELADTVKELRETLTQVRTLSGLLPICSSCKKIRDDKGYWTQVEVYVGEHSDADFTHSICPECARRLYPDYLKGDYAD